MREQTPSGQPSARRLPRALVVTFALAVIAAPLAATAAIVPATPRRLSCAPRATAVQRRAARRASRSRRPALPSAHTSRSRPGWASPRCCTSRRRAASSSTSASSGASSSSVSGPRTAARPGTPCRRREHRRRRRGHRRRSGEHRRRKERRRSGNCRDLDPVAGGPRARTRLGLRRPRLRELGGRTPAGHERRRRPDLLHPDDQQLDRDLRQVDPRSGRRVHVQRLHEPGAFREPLRHRQLRRPRRPLRQLREPLVHHRLRVQD